MRYKSLHDFTPALISPSPCLFSSHLLLPLRAGLFTWLFTRLNSPLNYHQYLSRIHTPDLSIPATLLLECKPLVENTVRFAEYLIFSTPNSACHMIDAHKYLLNKWMKEFNITIELCNYNTLQSG